MGFAILAEMPSNILALVLIDNPKFGRKYTIALGYLVSSISCLLSFYLSESYFMFTTAGI